MSILQDLMRFEGRRQQLLEDKNSYTQKVSEAKARLMYKDDVDDLLEEIQADFHRKTTLQYSNLLTAITKDVMPVPQNIVLQVYHERGVPALDIMTEDNGKTVSVMDDSGGGLTNVISLGLRLIATVRSGNRKFVIMDEPDCWIDTPRVPNFFGVVQDMTDEMKDESLQCIVVSHHSYHLFKEKTNVLEFYRDKEENKVKCKNVHQGLQWKNEDEIGIRYIHLKNVQGHKDTKIELSPGLNAITGVINVGKSTVSRALGYVFYGEMHDGNIHGNEKKAEIIIGFEKGMTLHYSREIKRNPVNLWRLTDKDGKVMMIGDHRCEMGGKSAPEWVSMISGIKEVEGLNIQISNQKKPVFLLDQPPSKRASVLSVGHSTNHISTMIYKQKDRVKEDNQIVKLGETELNKINIQLENMINLDELIQSAKALEKMKQEIDEDEEYFLEMNEDIQKFSKMLNKQNFYEEISDIEIPTLPELENEESIFEDIDDFENLVKRFNKAKDISNVELPQLPVLENETDIVNDIISFEKLLNEYKKIDYSISIPILPELENEDIWKEISEYESLLDKMKQNETEYQKIQNQKNIVEKEIEDMIEMFGGKCPTCSQPLGSITHAH